MAMDIHGTKPCEEELILKPFSQLSNVLLKI